MRAAPREPRHGRARLGLAWLALGTVLTTASELRFAGALGPGELMLAAWAAGTFLLILCGRHLGVTPVGAHFLAFWVASCLLLGAGWLFALRAGSWTSKGWHSAVAFVFVACLLALFTTTPQLADRTKRLSALLIAFAVPPLVVLYAVSFVTPLVGPLELGGGIGIRFSGWAENPNQVALLMSGAPFLAWRHRRLARSDRRRLAWTASAAGAVLIGLATRSDALIGAWAAAGVLLLVIAIWRRLQDAAPLAGRRAYLYANILIVSATGVAAIVGYLLRDVPSRFTAGDFTQESVRLLLWKHGWDAVVASPLVGHGPGAFSGIAGPYLGLEAHNTYIDWATSTGLVGLGLLVFLLCWIAWRVGKSGSLALLGAFVTLVLFAAFHFVMRQPVFWFYLLALAALAQPRIDSSSQGALRILLSPRRHSRRSHVRY